MSTRKPALQPIDFNSNEIVGLGYVEIEADASDAKHAVRKGQAEQISDDAAQAIIKESANDASSDTTYSSSYTQARLDTKQANMSIGAGSTGFLSLSGPENSVLDIDLSAFNDVCVVDDPSIKTMAALLADPGTVSNGNGTYTVEYAVTSAGLYYVAVTLHDRHISGSPFAMQTFPAAARSSGSGRRGRASAVAVARRSRRPAFVWMTEHPCLATILDTSRLVRVGRLAEVWPGPISAAVLTAPATELFSEHRLVQAALASMVREPQRLRVTLMENTGCAPHSHSRAAPPLLLSLTSACPPLCPPSQLQLPRPLPFQRAAQPRALPLRRGAGAHRRRRDRQAQRRLPHRTGVCGFHTQIEKINPRIWVFRLVGYI